MTEMADTKKTPVVVPHLAETIVSAVVAKWLKRPGDRVEVYEAICELFTDKVNVEMPSPVAGVLLEILVPEGQSAAVGQPICVIGEESAAFATEDPDNGGTSDGTEPRPDRDGAESRSFAAGAAGSGSPQGVPDMRARYSPAVLKLAAKYGVDLSRVPGTGLGGRVTRKDVERFVAEGRHLVPTSSGAGTNGTDGGGTIASASPATPDRPAPHQPPVVEVPKVPVRSSGLHLVEHPPTPRIEVEGHDDTGRGETFIDVTPMRNLIASRMRQSVAEIPHAWTMIEADVTNLVLLRNRLKEEFYRQEGINLTYLAFVLKAVVNAIKDYPIINSVWATDKIIVKRDINISLAVGTEDAVLTPVIKNADRKNIAGLAREIDILTKKARSGKLTLEDMQGGTFTVNNTGSFGSILSYPIINYPQAAILTFESIVKRPVVINDMIAVRSMVNLCLSLDHRILDGVICGRFLQRVKENLESFGPDTQLY